MKKIHFVGIGGIGMSGLARFLAAKGIEVSGSDTDKNSEILQELEAEKITIFHQHEAKNISSDISEIIFSEAIPEKNRERLRGKELKITQKNFFQKLGEVSKKFRVIAVAGTHGKSTTTAMIAKIFEQADLDPAVILGTKIFEWGNKNVRIHKKKSDQEKKYFILEACEYRENFLQIFPEIVVVTNCEAEHLDFFKNAKNYFRAFAKFADLGKILVANFSDNKINKIFKNFSGTKISYSDFLPKVLPLKIPGKHNIENAAAAMAVGSFFQIPIKKINQSLQNFRGTWRRFEKKGEKNGIKVFDDYAHHPTEIRSTLEAFREIFPTEKLWVVFQPHQFSRTRFFLKQFAKSFTDADEILIPNIYRVRDKEEETKKNSLQNLIKEIKKNGKKVRHSKNFETTVKILQQEILPGEILVSMGAGPIFEVADKFLE